MPLHRGVSLQSVRLAHISDLHIGPLPGAGPFSLAGKRLTGFLSWRLKRRKIHQLAVLDRLIADIHDQSPDHIAVTGDLVNISLPNEFDQARIVLARLGAADAVTVIPGNHDAYVAMPFDRGMGKWADYMTGIRNLDSGGVSPPADARDFPFLRRIGNIALIGLSSALPTVPFSAAGELGTAQLERLSRALRQLGGEGLCRIVLIHHPPYGAAAHRRKSLRDIAGFTDVLKREGCELVLHGHTHVSGLGRIEMPSGQIPVIGVPSASAVGSGHKDPSRYHLYRISPLPDRPSCWQLEVAVRELNADISGYHAAGAMRFELGPQAPEAELRQRCA
jgi:3',5'-cyclic AMP phosphodiesterase CpdA